MILSLIFDSLKRFTPAQFYFTIYNKIAKKVYRKIFIPKYTLLKSSEIVSYQKTSLKLKNEFPVNIYNTQKYQCYYHQYYLKLLDVKLNANNLQFAWNDFSDFEINNNYHRFHLFDINNNIFIDNSINEIINLWIRNHPNIKAEPWSGFNTAMRTYNWLKLLAKNQENIAANDWFKIQSSLYIQAKHILNNIEHHIPGNHVLLQYFALWLILHFFPDWQLSIKNKSKIKNKLINEIKAEFLKCGFHFEQSYHYHIQITLMSLYVLEILKKQNSEIDYYILGVIKNAIKIAEKFQFADGHLPMLGDNCFNFFNPTLFEDIEQIKKIAIEVFGEEEDEEKKDIKLYKDQYIVVENNNSKLIFDIGPIGLYENPGHGHSDISSFIYSSQGITLFIDPGTKNYSSLEDDKQLKRSILHNTLSVDGEDQAKLWGFFRWAYLPKNNKYNFSNNDEFISLENEYEGFYSIGKIVHKRTLIIYNNKLIINDLVVGKGEHKLLFTFILNPQIKVIEDADRLILSAGEKNWEMKSKNCTGNFIIDNQFYYPSYGVGVATKRITFEINLVNLPFQNEIMIKFIEA